MSYFGYKTPEDNAAHAELIQGEYVTIRLEGQMFAFPLRPFCEVVSQPDYVTPPPGAQQPDGGRFLTYHMAYGGQTITVYDLRECLGFPLANPESDTNVLVVRRYGQVYGFIVDGLGQIIRSSYIEQMTAPFELMTNWRLFCDGVCSLFGQPLVVLNPLKLCETIEGQNPPV